MSLSPELPSKNNSIPAFQKYQYQFVDYIRNPLEYGNLPKTLPQRSNVYAKLLHSKIEGSLDTCFPVSCQLLGSERWQQLIQEFIKEHHCKSPLYREIPDEFIDFLMNEQKQLKIPPFIIELAHFEWIELVLETQTSVKSTNNSPVNGKLLPFIPILNPVLHLLHYHYPVQKISASDKYWQDWDNQKDPYPQIENVLAGLRDNDNNVHFIELNAVTARLIELIQEGKRTAEQALLDLAAEMHYDDTESILPFGAKILQQLEEQQIIIA